MDPRIRVRLQQSDDYLTDDPPAHRAQMETTGALSDIGVGYESRLLERVVPERRALLQAHAIRPQLVEIEWRQGVYVHDVSNRLTGWHRPRYLTQQGALRRRSRRRGMGGCPQRKREERRRDGGGVQPVRFVVAIVG